MNSDGRHFINLYVKIPSLLNWKRGRPVTSNYVGSSLFWIDLRPCQFGVVVGKKGRILITPVRAYHDGVLTSSARFLTWTLPGNDQSYLKIASRPSDRMYPIDLWLGLRANDVKLYTKIDTPLSLQRVGEYQLYLPLPSSLYYLIAVFTIQIANYGVSYETRAPQISP